MSTESLPQNKPNLVCPKCDSQSDKGEMRSFVKSDYESFAEGFVCLSCGKDIQPKGALFAYFRCVPISEISGRPVQIGVFATVATKELDVGKTVGEGPIGGDALDPTFSTLDTRSHQFPVCR